MKKLKIILAILPIIVLIILIIWVSNTLLINNENQYGKGGNGASAVMMIPAVNYMYKNNTNITQNRDHSFVSSSESVNPTNNNYLKLSYSFVVKDTNISDKYDIIVNKINSYSNSTIDFVSYSKGYCGTDCDNVCNTGYNITNNCGNGFLGEIKFKIPSDKLDEFRKFVKEDLNKKLYIENIRGESKKLDIDSLNANITNEERSIDLLISRKNKEVEKYDNKIKSLSAQVNNDNKTSINEMIEYEKKSHEITINSLNVDIASFNRNISNWNKKKLEIKENVELVTGHIRLIEINLFDKLLLTTNEIVLYSILFIIAITAIISPIKYYKKLFNDNNK